MWASKLDAFNEKSIKPIILKLEESVKQTNSTIKSNKEEAVMHFKEVEADIMKNKNSIIVGNR